MKLYKAGAVFLTLACCISNIPLTVLAEDIQQTAKEGKTAENAASQKEEDTQKKHGEKSKNGAITNLNGSSKTESLTSKNKTEEAENKNTANKKLEENKEQGNSEQPTEEKQIPITSIGDFQKIGTEGYPLDGNYVLQNDIDGMDIESRKSTETEPFIDAEQPFRGSINGNGHTIANFIVKRAEEGERNTSMFGLFGGRLEEINFLNIQVISEKHSAALIGEQIEGAELKNMILSGNVVLSESEELSEEEQRTASTIALQTDGKKWKEFIKEKEQKTKFTNVKIASGGEDIAENLPKGLTKIETSPEYLSTVEGVKEIIEAPELEGFTFLSWTVENKDNSVQEFEGEITNPENRKTKISGKEGKYRLKAAYEYELKNVNNEEQNEVNNQDIKQMNKKDAVVQEESGRENQEASETQKENTTAPVKEGSESGSMETEASPAANSGEDKTADSVAEKHTADLILEVPYIVGKDIKNIEKLIPIDNVFPKQISAVMYLDAIDGVFPKYMEVGKKTDGETISITSWEQFKNIGNTDYNSHYAMNANYVLKANIYSDGKAFTPIGTEENPFTGSFDGNGFEIDVSNNPEIDTNSDYSGLFKVVKSQKQEMDTEESKTEAEEEVKEEE